eukprot:361839-Chlamydomonas_euryale.AAC.19
MVWQHGGGAVRQGFSVRYEELTAGATEALSSSKICFRSSATPPQQLLCNASTHMQVWAHA